MVNRNRYNNSCQCNSADYGNCNMGRERNSAMNTNVSGLMNRLRKVEFALVDIGLYLDAYPHCIAAMEYYKKLLAEHKMICEKLEKSGYPVNVASDFGDSWNWINSPWPWEYEANV